MADYTVPEVQTAVNKAVVNADRLDVFVNGDADQIVAYDNGSSKTLAGIRRDATVAANGAADSATKAAASAALIGPNAETYVFATSGTGTAGSAAAIEHARLRMTAADTVAFTGMTLYALGKDGLLRSYKGNGGIVGSFKFAADEQLRWVWDSTSTGTIVKVAAGTASTDPYMVLLYYTGGLFQGVLKDQVASELNSQYHLLAFGPSSTAVVKTAQARLQRVGKNQLVFNQFEFLILNKTNSVRAQLAGAGYTATVVFAENDFLWFDFATSTISKLPGATTAQPPGGILLTWFYSGKFQVGALTDAIRAAETRQPMVAGPVAEVRRKVFPNKSVDQGIVVTPSRIYSAGFENNQYPGDGFSQLRMWANDLEGGFPEITPSLTHNFGHDFGLDYAINQDTMLGTVTGDAAHQATLYLVHGISAKAPGAVVDYNDPVGTPRTEIRFYEKDSSGNVTKQIANGLGLGGCLACFMGRPDMVFMEGYDRNFFVVQLGMGAANISDQTSDRSDLTRWGTFIAGKAANEWNGTARILQGPLVPDSGALAEGTALGMRYEGMCWHDGDILYGYKSYPGDDAPKIVRMRVGPSKMLPVASFRHDTFDVNGALIEFEGQGCQIYDGRYLMIGTLGKDGRGSGSFVLFPLPGKDQGGRGVVGTGGTVVVGLHFASGAMAPRVQVTPTSAATGLYVSAVDPVAGTFTVTGPANATFNWSAPIT